MEWTKNIPRKSGWYWVKLPPDEIVIMHIEGRDKAYDGWVWLDGASRYYLTPGVRYECGDDKQSEQWMEWEWAGPIPPPNGGVERRESSPVRSHDLLAATKKGQV